MANPTQFVEYQKNGRESDYWFGVADFRLFKMHTF